MSAREARWPHIWWSDSCRSLLGQKRNSRTIPDPAVPKRFLIPGRGASLSPVALELPSNEAVRAAVEGGAGATAISELVAECGLRSGTLARVKFRLPERTFRVLRHRERYRSKAADAFMTLVGKTA